MAVSRVCEDGQPPVVSVVSREMVVPSKPTERHNYFLSCFDIFWKVNHYNQRLIFYESTRSLCLCTEGSSVLSGQEVVSGQNAAPGAVDGRGAVMEKLKSSLALCLVHYYPWCGRLAIDGEPDHRLVIDCNDAGVEFVEAYIDLPISLLSQQGFQMKPFFEKLCQHVDHSGDCLYSSPLLSIQATLFSDGGLALGITQTHVVADGQSLWNFMASWGECAREVPLSLPPVLNRKLLAVPDPSPEKATWNFVIGMNGEDIKEEEEKQTVDDVLLQKDGDGVVTNSSSQEDKVSTESSHNVGTHSVLDENGSSKEAVGIDSTVSGDSVGTSPSIKEDPKLTPLMQCFFTMPSSAIKQLKVEDGEVHTSYEVMCAHLWQRVTVARQQPSHEHTSMVVLANCRSRVKPPLPSAYFGNAITVKLHATRVDKFCTETLHATANRIHNTVVDILKDSCVDFMHWLETHDNNLMSLIRPQIPKGKGIVMASSPRFPVYTIDFGWGKPQAVRSAKVPGAGEMVLFGGNPTSNPGDVEICIALPEDELRRLLEDPKFLGKLPSSPFSN